MSQKKETHSIEFETPTDDQSMQDIFDQIPTDTSKQPKSVSVLLPKNTKKHSKKKKSSAPQAQLDLHGQTSNEAVISVKEFIQQSYRSSYNTVLIITGRGNHSGNDGPILKDIVWQWLEQHRGKYGYRFAQAPSEHGGEGAIFINLRKKN